MNKPSPLRFLNSPAFCLCTQANWQKQSRTAAMDGVAAHARAGSENCFARVRDRCCLRGLFTLLGWRRREPVFPSSRSDERAVVGHWSDERQRNRENWPRPFGLRRKFGHTSLPASTVGPATVFGRRLVWPNFRSQRHHPNSVSRPQGGPPADDLTGTTATSGF